MMRPSDPSAPRALFTRVLGAGAVAVLGVGAASLLLDGASDQPLLHLLQGLALFGLGTLGLLAGVAFVIVRLGGWREADADFDRRVERSEALAAGTGSDPFVFSADAPNFAEELELAEADQDFDELVRAAVEELPLEFHRVLEHVAIVVSDSGARALGGRGARARARRGAYGLYQGDTVAHDFFTERIFIFRDTLLRDFGHDPELLAQQVRRVLRHELAHHLGWGEQGVRKLGL